MSPKLKPQYKLTSRQQKELAEIVCDQFGPHLDKVEFTDQVLMLFEDMAGFEGISDSDSETIINQLWSHYHGQA